MAIEIVDFPIKNGESFHCYVSSPEGISVSPNIFFWDKPWSKSGMIMDISIQYKSISKEFMITPQGLVCYTIHPTLDLLSYMIYIYIYIYVYRTYLFQ